MLPCLSGAALADGRAIAALLVNQEHAHSTRAQRVNTPDTRLRRSMGD
jgi:hypothetical protein